MRPRAFRIYTQEGSTFIARFDPHKEHPGYGTLDVIGVSRTTNTRLRIKGIGAIPESGGKIVVSDRPEEVVFIENEEVKIFPQEVIAGVEEIDLEQF